MKRHFVVTRTIPQTEIPTLPDIWVTNTTSVKILCPQKNCLSLHYRKNITCLSVGLLKIGQFFFLSCTSVDGWVTTIAVFTHGPQGPEPRAANFQGRHIKKNRDWNMVCGKKRLSTREKFKGDLYWKQCWYHSATEFSRCFCLHITEYEQIRGGAQNFLGPRGVKYLNTGLVTTNYCFRGVVVRSRSVANKQIADTQSTKFLGLIIDNILLRKNRFDQLMSKLTKEYYAVRAAKSFMNEKR